VPAALKLGWDARVGFVPSLLAQAIPERAAVGPTTVSITLWPRNLSLFATLPPGEPPMTPAEIADHYGRSAQEYSAMENYFVAHGLRVVHAWTDRLALTVSGSSANVSSAFGTVLSVGSWQNQSVVFPELAPVLPANIEAQVASVSGLTSGFSKQSLPFLPSPRAAAPHSEAANPFQGRTTSTVTPQGARVAYGISALYNYTGSAQYANNMGLVLLLWGRGYSPSDISTFFSNYFGSGYPVPTIRAYPVDGASPPSSSAVNDPSRGALELTLDLEWAGSAAPGATLDAVYAPAGTNASNGYSPSDPQLEDALNTAVNNIGGVRVISMSFGGSDGQDAAFQAAFSTSFAAAQKQGITLIAASGDNGGVSGSLCSGSVDPQFPASSPQVLSVGGTAPILSENLLGQVQGIESEPAWNLSGGGFSKAYATPSWQAVSGIRASGHRGIPDVAGPAAQNFFYFNAREQLGQGTSFAAPLWAGIIAEMDALHGVPLGFLTPRLYSIGGSPGPSGSGGGLVDITNGANCLGPATVGWDTATGWGSPRAVRLYQEISATFVLVNLTASPSTVSPGGSVQALVLVENATSYKPLANVPVSLIVQAVGVSGPCSGTLSSTTGSTNASGTALVSMSVPACYLGSKASLSATVQTNGLFGQNSTDFAINLLGFAGFLAFIQSFPYNLIAFVLIMTVAIVAGWRIGRWRRRRRPAYPAPTNTNVLSPLPTGPSSAPGASGSVPPAGGPTLQVSEGVSATPITPTPAIAPTSGATRNCPACGNSQASTSARCERCGAPL
jgi:kumamolisin